MKLVFLPLMLMIFSAIFFQLYNSGAYDVDNGTELSLGGVNVTQSVNGSDTSIEYDLYGVPITFDIQSGALAIILSSLVLVVIVGINIVGSGMSDFGGKAIYITVLFYGMWVFFSTLGIGMYTAIPVFGWIAYLVMTIVYSMGIMEMVGGV